MTIPGTTEWDSEPSAWPMILIGLQGAATVLLLIPLIRNWTMRHRIGRYAREIHQTHRAPISRLGGLALAAAFLVAAITTSFFSPADAEKTRLRFVVVAGALTMFGLGFWDDIKALGARRKLLAQILISLLVYQFGVRIENVSNPFTHGLIHLGAGSALVTVLWLVGMTNLINLIDGIDGLAGGICLLLMLLLAYVQRSMDAFPLLACGMAGSLGGFLVFNFPPAKIYMGDGGAYFLGFLIGELTIVSSHKGTVMAALIAPLFVLALPILDVSMAILRRGLKGLPIFRPDRRHLHHKLEGMGLSRRRVVLGMYCFTVIFLVLGLVVFQSQGRLLPILTGVAILIFLFIAGSIKVTREWFAVGHVIGNSLRSREEISYTVSLTHWLELEGRRVQEVEELWKLLAFAAERAGMSYARLRLEDGEREWNKNGEKNLCYHFKRFDFQSRGTGFVEFKAEVCPHCEHGEGKKICKIQPGEIGWCIGNHRLFDIVSELLAEGWHKASRHLQMENSGLKFSSPAESIEIKSYEEKKSSRFKRLVGRCFAGVK